MLLSPFVARHVPYTSDEVRQDFLRGYQARLQGLEQKAPLAFPRMEQFDDRLYPLAR